MLVISDFVGLIYVKGKYKHITLKTSNPCFHVSMVKWNVEKNVLSSITNLKILISCHTIIILFCPFS